MTTPLCILLVDDSRFFLTLGQQFLRNTPATIYTADNGADALELAHRYAPSLVYMDVDMPEMAGTECCRLFKNDPELKNIPIILIGNRERPQEKSDAEAVRCDGYLEKPLDRRRFLDLGHSFLFSIDRREPRRNIRFPVTMTCYGQVCSVEALDLSSGGMFVVCDAEAAEGDKLLLQFHLPGRQAESLSLTGRIAWVNTVDQSHKPDYPEGYGVEFLEMPEEAGILLRRYIDQG